MSIGCCARFQHMNLFGKSAWVLLLLLGTSVLWFVGLPGNLSFLLFMFAPFLLGGVITGLVLYGLALGVVRLLECRKK